MGCEPTQGKLRLLGMVAGWHGEGLMETHWPAVLGPAGAWPDCCPVGGGNSHLYAEIGVLVTENTVLRGGVDMGVPVGSRTLATSLPQINAFIYFFLNPNHRFP